MNTYVYIVYGWRMCVKHVMFFADRYQKKHVLKCHDLKKSIENPYILLKRRSTVISK